MSAAAAIASAPPLQNHIHPPDWLINGAMWFVGAYLLFIVVVVIGALLDKWRKKNG